jgi:hypothetical protein
MDQARCSAATKGLPLFTNDGSAPVNLDRMPAVHGGLLVTLEVPPVSYTAMIDEALRARKIPSLAIDAY